MRKVAEEMKKTYRVLAEEFAISNFQLQMGRPRAEVLHELGLRTGVSDLRSLAGVLIQADKFGSRIPPSPWSARVSPKWPETNGLGPIETRLEELSIAAAPLLPIIIQESCGVGGCLSRQVNAPMEGP